MRLADDNARIGKSRFPGENRSVASALVIPGGSIPRRRDSRRATTCCAPVRPAPRRRSATSSGHGGKGGKRRGEKGEGEKGPGSIGEKGPGSINSQRQLALPRIIGGKKRARFNFYQARPIPRRPRIHIDGLPLHIIQQRGHNRTACFFDNTDGVNGVTISRTPINRRRKLLAIVCDNLGQFSTKRCVVLPPRRQFSLWWLGHGKGASGKGARVNFCSFSRPCPPCPPFRAFPGAPPASSPSPR